MRFDGLMRRHRHEHPTGQGVGFASRLVGMLAVATLGCATSEARPLAAEDLTQLSRLAAPTVSSDNRWLVWTQRETDVTANRGRLDLWRLDLSGKSRTPVKLAAEPEVDERDSQIVGDLIYFSANRGGEDAVWVVPPRRVTNLKGGFNGFKVSPTGDRLVVWADRKPGAATLAPDSSATAVGDARAYDQLMVRHWHSWSDGQRQQPFVLPLTPAGATGNGRAIIGQLVGDTPSKPFGGGEEIAWSPDGRTIYFTLREAGRIEALSTNLDIFEVPADGSRAPVILTKDNEAIDIGPSGAFELFAAASGLLIFTALTIWLYRATMHRSR